MYPLFQPYWDRRDQQYHQTQLVKGQHLYSGKGN
jgi:hypothetical protein